MAESGIETSVNGAPTMQFTFVQRGKSCLWFATQAGVVGRVTSDSQSPRRLRRRWYHPDRFGAM